MKSPLLTRSEVCNRLACGRRTVERLTARGELQCIHIGVRARYDESDVESYIKRNKTKNPRWLPPLFYSEHPSPRTTRTRRGRPS